MQYLPHRIFVDPVHFVKLGIFNSNLQVSELIHYCFRFRFRHPLHQSDSRLTPTASWSLAFSRASSGKLVLYFEGKYTVMKQKKISS